MKPLELRTYRKVWLDTGAVWVPVDAEGLEGAREPQDKRLTDAELAAEHWLLSSRRERMLGYNDGPGSATEKEARRATERMETVTRFATYPHYDEETPTA